MNLEKIKKLIAARTPLHNKYVLKAEVGRRYYLCKNDILNKDTRPEDESNPRNSNHKIPSTLFKTLVDQKVEYMFKTPPRVDTNDDALNAKINEVLGFKHPKIMQTIALDASTTGTGCMYMYKTGENMGDRDDEVNEFRYMRVDPFEVIPIWGGITNERLVALIWKHEQVDIDGNEYMVYEYFDNEFVYSYRRKITDTLNGLEAYNRYYWQNPTTGEWDKTNKFKHGFDRVPFCFFYNNPTHLSDLNGLKERIDAYDEVVSQLMNDLTDFQDVVWVLSGYGAEPPADFLQRLKENKLIKLESGYPDNIEPKVETISVEIPTDARDLGITENKKAVIEQGGGVDNSPEALQYTSNETVKYRYANLELKCNFMQNEFISGYYIFIKEICKHLGKPKKDSEIELKWMRSRINNDNELMNNARLCFGFTSLKTALSVCPYVEDVDKEMKQIEEERKKEMELIPNMEMVRTSSNDDSDKNGNLDTDNLAKKQLDQKDSERKSNTPEKYTQSSRQTTTVSQG